MGFVIAGIDDLVKITEEIKNELVKIRETIIREPFNPNKVSNWGKTLIPGKSLGEPIKVEEYKEPQIGELCWFWDYSFHFAILSILVEIKNPFYEPFEQKRKMFVSRLNTDEKEWVYCRSAKDHFIDYIHKDFINQKENKSNGN